MEQKRKKAVPKRLTAFKEESPDVSFEQAIEKINITYGEIENKIKYKLLGRELAELGVYLKYKAVFSNEINAIRSALELYEIVSVGPCDFDWFVDRISKIRINYAIDLERYKTIIVNLINVVNKHCQVAPSLIPGAGMGLYAAKDFEEHERITFYGGVFCSAAMGELFNLKGSVCDYIFTFSDGNVRDAYVYFKIKDELGRWINSNKERVNAYFIPEILQGDPLPHVVVYAYKPIKKGEEIYVDYGDLYKIN